MDVAFRNMNMDPHCVQPKIQKQKTTTEKELPDYPRAIEVNHIPHSPSVPSRKNNLIHLSDRSTKPLFTNKQNEEYLLRITIKGEIYCKEWTIWIMKLTYA